MRRGQMGPLADSIIIGAGLVAVVYALLVVFAAPAQREYPAHDVVMRSPDVTCRGWHTQEWEFGNPPTLWLCDDGRKVYDHSGVKNPVETQ